MSVFDDMVAILNQINEKLGPNAGDRAQAINPGQKNPKDGEFAAKDNNADIIHGFRDALNSVPIFSKLQAALVGLQPLFRELISTGTILGAGAIYKNLTNKLSDSEIIAKASNKVFDQMSNEERASKTHAVSEDYSVRYVDKDTQSKISDEAAKIADEEASKTASENKKNSSRIMKIFGFDEWEKLFKNITTIGQNLKKPLQESGKTILDFYKGLFGVATGNNKIGDVFKKLSSGGKSIGAGLGGALEGTEAVSLISLLAIPAVLVGVGAGLIKLSKSIADSQRSIAQYNGALATAFAFSDLRGLFRDISASGARAGSTSRFLEAWNDLADKFLPYENDFINGLLDLGTSLVKTTSVLLDIFGPALTALAGFIEKVAGLAGFVGDRLGEATRKGVGSDGQPLGNWQADPNEQASLKAFWTGAGERPLFGDSVPDGLTINGVKATPQETAASDAGWAKIWNKVKDGRDQGAHDSNFDKWSTDKKASNEFLKFVGAAYDAAKMAQEFYKKYSDQGVTGVEFMEAAATWNYDPQKDRAYEKLRPIHDNYRNVSGAAGGKR